MYLERNLEKPIQNINAQFPVLLLTGPRQVGKTTLLKHLCRDSRKYLSLDDLNLRMLARQDPALFMQRFPPPVLSAEIQYAPELLPYIKLKVDESGEKGLYWLTRSQQFQVMKGITESLAGRVAILNLLGLSLREKRQRTNINEPFLPELGRMPTSSSPSGVIHIDELFREIWLGSFPALATGNVQERDLYYSSYIQTYLTRDVKDLAQVGDENAFFQFIKICAARTAQLLNLSDLAWEADISVPTAKKWLSILVSSFQIFLLPSYHDNLIKRVVKTPKLYFLDTGLCSYLTNWSGCQKKWPPGL